jgi:hypothetical protein
LKIGVASWRCVETGPPGGRRFWHNSTISGLKLGRLTVTYFDENIKFYFTLEKITNLHKYCSFRFCGEFSFLKKFSFSQKVSKILDIFNQMPHN